MTREPTDRLEVFRNLLERARQQSSPFAENKQKASKLIATLSASERLILAQIVAGWSGEDIAEARGVEMTEFEAQRARLFAKINAVSTADAVRTGIYAGL